MNPLREVFYGTGVASPHDTDLNVTIPSSGEPTHSFTKIAHVIAEGDQLTINLKSNAQPDTTCHIVGYCATLTDPAKFKVVSITTNGKPNTTPPPNAAYPLGTDQIVFELRLAPREMTLIGIIIEVNGPGEQKKRYLCDPQVGNGPP